MRMFTERTNRVLALLGASSADIARAAGCDTSNISRMCSGARVPKNGGPAAARLVSGIYLFADDKNRVPTLRELLFCGEEVSAEDLKARLMAWLFEGMEPPARAAEGKTRARTPFRSFGEKLDAAMHLAELSNVRLSKLVSLDASYVSRFRTGVRSPRSNPKTVDTICTVLLDRLRMLDRLEALGRLSGVPADALTGEEGFLRFRDWLCDFDTEDRGAVVEKLLENIDAFSPEGMAFPDPGAMPAGPVDRREVYFGTGGLRAAVLRFLTEVAGAGPRELLLYSDQSMDWMVGDADFRQRWAAGMVRCVRGGTRIRIIHNLERDVGEMIDAIDQWLPLYMSGSIESWSCRKQADSRFSHTLFLCPGVACIEATCIAGHEEEGLYRYHTEEPMLLRCRRSFEHLLADSAPLVHIRSNLDAEQDVFAEAAGMTALVSTLSLATMPEETLGAILARSALDRADAEAVRAVWRSWRGTLERSLRDGFVYECVAVPEPEALRSGAVPVDIPGADLFYTPEEYAAHIRSILALSETQPNYRFWPLPEAPFANTHVVISAETVAVSRLRPPHVTFVISHPAMCEAFNAYADRVKAQCRRDRLTVRDRLEQYL